ncbi:MAG: hypothetical protein RQ867_00115 [Mariprofundaceae bacterium]|nr:hypothetical protein [Mariprofundaceae bacterium]
MMILLASLMLFSASAHAAKTLTYTIDHGTVGVITSGTEKVRLVIQASGNCRTIPYSVVADGVLAISGTFDLSKALSMPLDYTGVTLSCSDKAVTAEVEQAAKSGLF